MCVGYDLNLAEKQELSEQLLHSALQVNPGNTEARAVLASLTQTIDTIRYKPCR